MVVGHAATSTALQQGNRDAIRHLKVQKRIGALKEQVDGQKDKHMHIIMCEAVLLMADYKLSRKFKRLFATFSSQNIDEIIEKCRSIMIRETVHTDEAEDRLAQNAKLMDTLKELIGKKEEMMDTEETTEKPQVTLHSPRLKRLSDLHPDLVTLT